MRMTTPPAASVVGSLGNRLWGLWGERWCYCFLVRAWILAHPRRRSRGHVSGHSSRWTSWSLADDIRHTVLLRPHMIIARSVYPSPNLTLPVDNGNHSRTATSRDSCSRGCLAATIPAYPVSRATWWWIRWATCHALLDRFSAQNWPWTAGRRRESPLECWPGRFLCPTRWSWWTPTRDPKSTDLTTAVYARGRPPRGNTPSHPISLPTLSSRWRCDNTR